MKSRYLLARLGGATPEILRAAPTDATKHTAMGGVLLSTATVAAVSAVFALQASLRLDPVAAGVAGALWGLVILNLDRMLIVSMGRQRGWGSLGAAIPRLVLAVIIGTVISTPLVLKIFEPEITAQIKVDRIADAEELRRSIAGFDQPIQAKVEERDDVVAALRSPPTAASDPGVQAAQTRFDTASAAYQEAATDYTCELGGSPECSGRAGPGPIADGLLVVRDQRKAELDAAAADLQAAKDAAGAGIAEREQQRQDSLAADLARIEADLRFLEEQRSELAASADESSADNTGLLARLEALETLTADRPTLQLAHLALFLLFLSIEVLPILAKLLTSARRTPYDTLLERRETEAVESDEVWGGRQREIAEARSRVRATLEQDRAEAQIRAGKRANALLEETQTAIAAKAVQTWAAVAIARSDEQLAQWYRAHEGRAHAPANGTARPSGPNGARTATAPGPVPADPPPAGSPPTVPLATHTTASWPPPTPPLR